MTEEEFRHGKPATNGLRELASLDEIVQACGRKVHRVEVEGVGTLCLREMSVREREEFAEVLFGGESNKLVPNDRWQMATLTASLCNPEGERFYGNGNGLSFAELLAKFADQGELSQKISKQLGDYAIRLNGLNVGGAESDVVKNSGPAPDSSSS